MPSCFADGCRHSAGRISCKLFRFPSDTTQRQLWIDVFVYAGWKSEQLTSASTRYSIPNVKNRYIWVSLLRLNPKQRGFPWDNLCQIFRGCQWMAKVPNGEEK